MSDSFIKLNQPANGYDVSHGPVLVNVSNIRYISKNEVPDYSEEVTTYTENGTRIYLGDNGAHLCVTESFEEVSDIIENHDMFIML